MKQIKLTFLLAVLMSMVGVRALAIAVENGDGVIIYYNYINNGTELEVRGADNSQIINIPEEVTYNGTTYRVTSIGGGAFYFLHEDLESVTIPNSVTNIGQMAFMLCGKLTSVTIPNSVTSIGELAFAYCDLRSLTIGNSVTYIGARAFEACPDLTTVTFHCKEIDSWFRGRDSIKQLIIGDEVTSIVDHAFYRCSGLTSVIIGNSVTSIGSSAFYDAFCRTALTKVIVSDIAAWCGISFGNDSANPLSYVKRLYSDENTEITDLVIPNGVTSIGDYAFNYCSSLTSVTIPNSVTSIGDYAFNYCSSLTSVTIPNSVTSIGSEAFFGCGLTKVIVSDIAAWCGISFGNEYANPLYITHHLYSDENTEITDLVIPNGVTSIGIAAFMGCYGLTSVTIPNSVTSIGSEAFESCHLTSVTSLITEPFPIDKSTFSEYGYFNVYFTGATLKVPEGTIAKYKATDGWCFFSYIEELTTGIENVNRDTTTNDRYYTLDGREVEHPTKGIYILNGKKVVVK